MEIFSPLIVDAAYTAEDADTLNNAASAQIQTFFTKAPNMQPTQACELQTLLPPCHSDNLFIKCGGGDCVTQIMRRIPSSWFCAQAHAHDFWSICSESDVQFSTKSRRRPKAAQGRTKGIQRTANGSQRAPQREPKGIPKAAKGSQRKPKHTKIYKKNPDQPPKRPLC